MPSKYDPERRLVLDHRGDCPSKYAAIRAVS
jgi:hypothetical protein